MTTCIFSFKNMILVSASYHRGGNALLMLKKKKRKDSRDMTLNSRYQILWGVIRLGEGPGNDSFCNTDDPEDAKI